MAGILARNLLSGLVVLTLLVNVIPPVQPEQPPSQGDWDILGNVAIANETAFINGNVRVLPNATLTITGSVVIFNASFVLTVEQGGRLDMSSSSARRNDPGSGGSTFVINGNADFTGCDFDHAPVYYDSGADGQMLRCCFTSYETPVFIIGASVRIINCTFVDIPYNHNVLAYGGEVLVAGCRFFHTRDGWQPWPGAESGSLPTTSGILVTENRILNTEIGIWDNNGYGSAGGVSAVCYYYPFSGQGEFVAQQNLLSGFPIGILLNANMGWKVTLSSNTIIAFNTGIHIRYRANGPRIIENNSLDGGQYGIDFIEGWDDRILNNSISGCTLYGIRGSAQYTEVSCTIRDNRISGCRYGAWLDNTIGEFASNNISDCLFSALYARLAGDRMFSLAVQNNTVTRCGQYSDDSTPPCAVEVRGSFTGSVGLSGNRLFNNSHVGILMYGNVLAENNTVEGSETGIWSPYSAQSAINLNRIKGGKVGLMLEYPVDARENDISDVETGIKMELGSSGESLSRLSSNAIHAGRLGVSISDQYETALVVLQGNVIASGGDGLLADRALVNLSNNDFGGVRGYCVHAIGRAAELGTNEYGSLCAGWLLQEWYLSVRVQMSDLPYEGSQWYPANHFGVRVRIPPASSPSTVSSGALYSVELNLTQYFLNRTGGRTDMPQYEVAALKPHAGVGRALINLTSNLISTISLWPRSDLAVQDLWLPAGRPQLGQMVPVNVTVVDDATYDADPRAVPNIVVVLMDDGWPVAERKLSSIPPNGMVVLGLYWVAYPGTHVLSAAVDPDRYIPEAFEDNNVFSREVTVNSLPEPVLEISDRHPVAGQSVAFSSRLSTDDTAVVRSLFDFGDGTDSGWTEDSEVTHVYAAPGYYDAKLKVADADNATSDWSAAHVVLVGGPPLEVTLVADTGLADTLVPVAFAATVEGDHWSRIRYLWVFGDGTSQAGWNATRVEHAYQRPGTYVVSVNLTGDEGAGGSAALIITVRGRSPVASFGFSPPEPTVLTLVTFFSQSSDPDGAITKWLWDFGDGSQSSGPAPTHLYADDGCYTVMLAVQDDSGTWGIPAVRSLRVQNLAPTARARASALEVRAGATVELDGCLTIDVDDPPDSLTFCWSSSDSWQSSGERTSRRFDAPGKYRILMTVRDGSGAVAQDELAITVAAISAAPALDFGTLTAALSVSAAILFALCLLLWSRERKRG